MSDYYTHEHTGDHEITFCTEDKETYESVKKFCRQMSGGLMPNEPRYELRPIAKWVLEEAFTGLFICKCSNCGEYNNYGSAYCPHCGAKMENGN